MKKNYQTLIKTAFTAVLACSIFASCSLFDDLKDAQIPKTVSVKLTDSEFSVPLGSVDMKMSEYLNVASLQEKITNTAAEIYDYNELGKDPVQEYLINYPLAEVPLDFDDYLSKVDIPKEFSKSYDQSVNIPGNFVQHIDFDLPDLQFLLSNCFVPKRAEVWTIIEPGRTQEGIQSDRDTIDNPFELTYNILVPKFETLVYERGSLIISVTPVANEPSGDFILSLRPVIYDIRKEKVIARADFETQVNYTGTTYLIIDLKDVELKPNFVLVLEGNYYGGYKDQEDSYLIYADIYTNVPERNSLLNLSDDIKNKVSYTSIKKVTGLTMSSQEISETIPFGSTSSLGNGDGVEIDLSAISDVLYSAIIADGKISIKVDLPEGWSGIECKTSGLSLEGGINVDSFENKNGNEAYSLLNKVANLSGKTLIPDKTIIKGNYSFELNNAVLDFSKGNITTLDCEGALDITLLRHVEIKPNRFFDENKFSNTVSVEFSDSIRQFISKVEFSKISLLMTMNTNLMRQTLSPEAYDDNLWIYTSFSSNAFGISEPLEESYCVSDYLDNISYTIENPLKLDKTRDPICIYPGDPEIDSSKINAMDFNLSLSVGNNHKENRAIISELQTGKDYYLNTNVTVRCDWSAVEISTENTTEYVTGDIDASIDLRSLLKDFFSSEDEETEQEVKNIIDSIKFHGIKGYLFATRPHYVDDGEKKDPIPEGLGFKGDVYVTYSDDDLENPEKWGYLIENGSFVLKDSIVDFVSLSDENGTINDANTPLFRDKTYYSEKFTEDEVTGECTALSRILNEELDNCKMHYKLAFDGGDGNHLRLTYDQIQTLKSNGGKCALSFSVCLRLPLSLSIEPADLSDSIEIADVLKLAGNEMVEDCLKRESASEDSDLTKYSDIIKSVALKYSISTDTGLNMGASFYDANALISKKTIYVDDEVHTINFANHEITNILDPSRETGWEFLPKIGLFFEAGDYKVKRNSFIRIKASLIVNADGEYTIIGGDDDE